MQQKEFEIFKSLDFNMCAPTGSDILYCALKFIQEDFNLNIEYIYSLVSKFAIRHIFSTN